MWRHNKEKIASTSNSLSFLPAEWQQKRKDVDLYSAFHVQDTSNAHVTETEPPGCMYLGHRIAMKCQLS